jgi:N-acetylglucosaminyldiphosphoundecaprenol N-acetyl-beta-D-mannosaminyltransferase
MKTVDVAGLKVFAEKRSVALQYTQDRLDQGLQTKIFTPYSEFLVSALQDSTFLTALNQAYINLPDGVGVIWAAKFLNTKRLFQSRFLEAVRLFLRVVLTGASIVLRPQSIYRLIPEKIPGSEFVYDLCSMAEQKQRSVFLLGGAGEVGQRAGSILQGKFPKLKIAGYCNLDMNDARIDSLVNRTSPDMLLVAFKPQAQEVWINNHLAKLPSVKVAIGLGGTFDYIAGLYPTTPRFLKHIGIEWLYRLFTQPFRIKRIYRATVGLIFALVKYRLSALDEKP